jgi:hypothetical protein
MTTHKSSAISIALNLLVNGFFILSSSLFPSLDLRQNQLAAALRAFSRQTLIKISIAALPQASIFIFARRKNPAQFRSPFNAAASLFY